MDTQHIRNAYLQRSVSDIDMSFGKFSACYLGVKDNELEAESNVSAACNYILKKGYNIYKEYHNKEQALQAKIDALMLEYCPEDMTKEQLEEWAAHQKPVSDGLENKINLALNIGISHGQTPHNSDSA